MIMLYGINKPPLPLSLPPTVIVVGERGHLSGWMGKRVWMDSEVCSSRIGLCSRGAEEEEVPPPPRQSQKRERERKEY